MKKVILILFAIATVFSVRAQDERFSMGLKGGYTSTRFDLSNYDQRLLQIDDHDSKSGYLAGIYTRVKIFKGLSFQPEFYYAKKQGEISFSGVNNDFPFPDTSYVTKVQAWELPLLVHLKLIKFEIGNIYVVSGPVISFIKKGETDPDEGFDFNKSTWTMMLGGGIEIWRVSVDARYEWGLGDVATIGDVGKFYRMLSVSVGFKLFGI